MKKLALIAALCAVTMLMLASAAFAIQAPYTHGDFGSNSKGCGDCHVTHSANVAKLLMTRDGSSTQTAFCFGCHGYLSPFNVKAGVVMKQSAEGNVNWPIETRFTWNGAAVDASNSNWSLAGGFATAGNFEVGNTVPGVADVVYGNLSNVTSIHNVRGVQSAVGTIADVTTYEYVYDQTKATNVIPGGTNTLDFECGSCHDPHAGGLYPSGTKNPRLLKAEILGRTGMQVVFTVDQAQNLPTKYDSGINNWCGACHDIFDTSPQGARVGIDPVTSTRTGYYKVGTRTKYMHLFGIDVVDSAKWGGKTGPEGRHDPFKVQFLALSAADDKEITCLTCHRAHGSSAPTSNQWTRYDAYNDYDGSGTNTTGKGSALLRLPNRDVCFLCHGAATYNHSITHTTSTTE